MGGAEISARDIAAGLTERGHTVTILTSWYGLQRPQREGAIRRTLQYIPPPHLDQQRSKWQQLSLLYQFYKGYHNVANAQELRRVLADCQPDVIYLWEVTGLGSNSLIKGLQDLHIPVIFQLGSYWLQYAYSPQTEQSHLRLRWLKNLLIGSVPDFTYTSLIAVSETVKQKYIESGCDANRIEIIYNGIDPVFTDTPRFAQKETVDKNITQLLFVGRVCTEKGILVICKALDILINTQGRRDPHLNIFGAGEPGYLKELCSYLQEKQLMQVVTFHGKVSQEELIQRYDRSDIMLIPSLWQEPFGLVVVEAMARGLPVIASRVGGPAEIVTHEKDGLLVAPDDAQALAEAIERLLTEQELCARLAQEAPHTVLERFTIEENVRRVEQHLLQQVEMATRGKEHADWRVSV
jgi:glycosyltransferase involved in cell wall biosynthesis